MNYIFIDVAFFLAGSFFTRVIPHLGHFPGLSLNTSGCMVQVYCTLAGLTFLVLVVSETAVVEWDAKTLAAENKIAMAIRVTFFMKIKIKKNGKLA
jgi:hypothetical protein